jgi:hypothetical protein
MLAKFINHSRHREYMSGIEREKSRTKATGEVFTPTPLVQSMIDKLPIELFTDPTKTYLDPTCGDGQFLSEVIIKKLENGSTYQQALMTTYGTDLMMDNCIETIKRLYMVNENQIEPITGAKLKEVAKKWQSNGLLALFRIRNTDGTLFRLKRPDGTLSSYINIVQADGLTYDYSFGSK